MLSFVKTINSLFSSFNERINNDTIEFDQSIQGPITWLSENGWGEGSGGGFNRLNYNYTRQLSQSGATINGQIASTLSAFWACTQMISTDIAKLPLNIYELDGRGNKIQRNNHPLWKVISKSPDGQITSQDFWESFILHTLVWGNGEALIGPRDPSNGQINQMELIHPNLVNIRKVKGIRFYEIFPTADDLTLNRNKIRDVPQEEMLHLHGPGDGYSGWPIANFAKEALGITLSLQELQASLFSNGMSLGGTLTTKEELDPIHRKQMAKEWTATHGGAANRNKVAILDKSIEYKQFSDNAIDAEVLESRKFQLLEVARFFRVPPHKLGITDASTQNNIEQENIKYVTETLSPWIKKIQNLISFRLFASDSKFFAEFDLKELNLADTKTKMDFWSNGIKIGMATPNQAAQSFDLPTYPDGDEHYIPANNLQPVTVANMGVEKAELALTNQELQNEQLEKNNKEQSNDNNTDHGSDHGDEETPDELKSGNPKSKRDNPQNESKNLEFNQAALISIFTYRSLIEAQLKQCINKEKAFHERRAKNRAKLGDDYDSSKDDEKITRFYSEQKSYLRDCLVTYFEVLNMPEPQGFINKWSNWQEMENWPEHKAFLIANDMIKYYCGIEDWPDGRYEYDDPEDNENKILLLENGILKVNPN